MLAVPATPGSLEGPHGHFTGAYHSPGGPSVTMGLLCSINHWPHRLLIVCMYVCMQVCVCVCVCVCVHRMLLSGAVLVVLQKCA